MCAKYEAQIGVNMGSPEIAPLDACEKPRVHCRGQRIFAPVSEFVDL